MEITDEGAKLKRKLIIIGIAFITINCMKKGFKPYISAEYYINRLIDTYKSCKNEEQKKIYNEVILIFLDSIPIKHIF